ncbi:MAG: hypothetical protein QOI20_379 [Acidimicrobiaceae bacterium]|jgi:signal transduction histidine kinase|nr:hypothetical protein [Acidimicrobiaceae bacterium]
MDQRQAVGTIAFTTGLRDTGLRDVGLGDDEAAGLRVLAQVVAETADLALALREINRRVAAPRGLRVAGCCFTGAQMRAATGAPVPSDDELTAIQRWRAAARRDEPLDITLGRGDPADADLLVPIVQRRRVHGVVRVQRTGDEAPSPMATGLLSAIGVGCGEVARKAGLRRELGRARRRLAIAEEQERMARDAQASVHRQLTVLGDRLACHLADTPDRVWRRRMQELLALAGEADREVRQSLNMLQSLPAQDDDLPSSLRHLAKGVSQTTNLVVKVFVDGRPRRLSRGRTVALFHVAVEALLAAALTARAGNAVVVLEYRPDDVHLEVRDDGVGLSHRQVFGTAVSAGLRGAQERLSRVDGRLRLFGMRPTGAVVQATVPRRTAAR